MTNKVNNKIYIGYTHKNLSSYMNARFKAAENNLYPTRLLYNAIRKYGRDKFEYAAIDCAKNMDSAKLLEIKYITEHNSYYKNEKGYNMTTGGDGVDSERMPEVGQKIKNAWTKERRLANSRRFSGRCNPMYGKRNGGNKNGMYQKTPWNKGKSYSPEMLERYREIFKNPSRRERIRKSKCGKNNPNFGKPEAARFLGDNKMGNNGRAKPITLDGVSYSCIKEACQKLSVSRRKILKLLLLNRATI